MKPQEPSQQPATIEELIRENQSLREELRKAHTEIERLRKELEEALRALKRQAAPFSRRKPKKNPKRPGRKPGKSYGLYASRPVPERVDEQIAVPLPAQCGCGGPTVYEQTQPQFQEDIVRQTIVRRFDVEIGHCLDCGCRVQGRHALQTSDALGAAQVQIGPEALSLATHLNKEMGISHERADRVLQLGYGLKVSRSGLCRAILRLGRKAAPTYQQLQVAVQHSRVNWMDDDGWLIHDGWAPYYKFLNAIHQSCLSHLIIRCKHLIETVSPAAAEFPSAVLELLKRALELGRRYAQGEVSRQGLAIATGRLESAMDLLLSRHYRTEANRRLAKHLGHEQPWLFMFLHCPGLDPTNNAAERALRPAVIARKTWGGNRTQDGASAQQTLMSVLRTCHQQAKDSFERIVELLRSPTPVVMDIVPLSGSP
jgi:transposase